MVKKIGVIGAGTMGIGVSVDLLLNGYDVVLIDISQEILNKANEKIHQTIKFAPLANSSLPKLSKERVDELLHTSLDFSDVSDCSIIIENVDENLEAKEKLYKKLDSYCSDDAIIGVNTSCIPITQIGSFTRRPDKVIGVHLMNPVFLKSAAEVIIGTYTSSETVESMEAFLATLNKKAIVINDSAGFVTNRISHLFMNEAAFIVYEGIAEPSKVDEIFKKCYGHKMGPLETADLIGIDTVVNSLNILYEYYQDSKFRCCPLLKQMVFAGKLGRKSGKGFYNY